jgi:hypothetical protein
MADNQFSVAGHLELASNPKALDKQSQRSLPTHPWVDYAFLALLACLTVGFWVGVAWLIRMVWKR